MTPKTSGAAIASLITGICSITCLGLIAGIPAIICGHIARKNINAAPLLLKGKGMALAGLIMGYFSIVITVVAVMAALALPAITGALEKGKLTQQMSNGRQVYFLLQSASLNATAEGSNDKGFPADIKADSMQQVCDSLVSKGYLKEESIRSLVAGFEMGNVSSQDPTNTILLRSYPKKDGGPICVILSGGDCFISPTPDLNEREVLLPPREPQFLP